ncbi:DnaJ sub C member 24 [Geranomyces variabilis]|uniref:Diphthamide biosynthesis protein 4 n=1 Tax=Geranomyces variabilis TaxID=109894 RepID=A0AAD5TMX7_9FUNG|nr:DnaJ sub C member 24 [Geranomyces variabilis]
MNASTPTHYEALQVQPSASQDHIRKQYQRLVLQHHPDKAPQKAAHASVSKATDTSERFRSVVAAYEVLGDPELRAAYDEELAGRSAATLGPLHAEVDLDDMQHDSAAELFSLPCRCGGSYVIREAELEDSVDIVGCSTCSLRIRVLYAEVEQEPTTGV